MKTALVEKFSTKHTQAEAMKEEVSLVHNSGNTNEFFVKLNKL